MALINWSENFSVNIKEIDEQHKKLIFMLNDLHDAMKSGKGNDVMEKIFDGLLQYVGTHFATEEKYMSLHNYPGYIAHKTEHTKLTQKVLDLNKKFQQGAPVLTVELLGFLKDWLQNHIMGTDKKYGPFLNEKGIF
jgi:hemerythrin